jgi:Cysteine rich repeat
LHHAPPYSGLAGAVINHFHPGNVICPERTGRTRGITASERKDVKMMIRAILISAAILSVCSTALAQSGSSDEQEACRPDVRKFCHKIKMADGNAAFLECLKANRDKLSKLCRAALESNGQ